MKIAIKANHNRGKEIISLLESLGSTKTALSGDGDLYTYYIDENHVIRYGDPPINYKVYTLEEFEKEFPFKVGDKVTFKDDDYPYTIKAFDIWSDGDIVCEFVENGLHYSINKIKPYKKMKEERNITLTLDKAKEWYKKGGELKEVALQAFNEEELTKIELPKTWKEFCKNHPKQKHETYIGIFSTIETYGEISDRHYIQDKNLCPSEKSAEAHLAMMQLEQLRNCWWNGWKPEWDFGAKYAIKNSEDELCIILIYNIAEFLAFPTREMAEEFLKCFRDLIEQAGDLI